MISPLMGNKAKLPAYSVLQEISKGSRYVHWLEIESAAYKRVPCYILQSDFESLAHKPDTVMLSPAPTGHLNLTQPLT